MSIMQDYENIRKDCSIKYFAPKGASLMGESS